MNNENTWGGTGFAIGVVVGALLAGLLYGQLESLPALSLFVILVAVVIFFGTLGCGLGMSLARKDNERYLEMLKRTEQQRSCD